MYQEKVNVSSDGKYHFSNTDLSGVAQISILFYMNDDDDYSWTFPYNGDKYDYYLLGTLVANSNEVSGDDMSTFKPQFIKPRYYSVYDSTSYYYNVSDLFVYDIDTAYSKGFGFYEKVDFAGAGNTGIRDITFASDKDGSGNKPSKLILELAVMAVEKTADTQSITTAILNQLELMEDSVNSNINLGNQLQQEANNMAQGVLDDANNAFDGESEIVNDAVSDYEQAESALLDDNISSLENYEFDNIFTNESDFGFAAAFSWVGSWLQNIYLSSDFKIVFGFTVSMLIASILVGLRRMWR